MGAILAGIILGGLVAFIITFAILKISDVVARFKERQKTKTDSQNALTTILGNPDYVAGITGISLGELENLMGSEGLFEVPIIDDKVDVDNITVLKTDEQEEKLSSILKSNGGVIKLTA